MFLEYYSTVNIFQEPVPFITCSVRFRMLKKKPKKQINDWGEKHHKHVMRAQLPPPVIASVRAANVNAAI